MSYTKISFFIHLIFLSRHLGYSLQVHKPKLRGASRDFYEEYPYIVTLGVLSMTVENGTLIPGQFLDTCSGSFISDEWLLTASRCVSRPEPNRVKYGRKPKYLKIIKCLKHPAYKFDSNHLFVNSKNDVGLVKTEYVSLKSYGRISAVDYKAFIGLPVKYFGFKRSYTIGGRKRLERRIGNGYAVSCKKITRDCVNPLICLHKLSREIMTSADFGGPVIQGGRIIGVYSALSEKNGYETQYAPLSLSLNWITMCFSKLISLHKMPSSITHV